jgi:hypothetical protein
MERRRDLERAVQLVAQQAENASAIVDRPTTRTKRIEPRHTPSEDAALWLLKAKADLERELGRLFEGTGSSHSIPDSVAGE